MEDDPSRYLIGIDAAVVADHQVVVRRPGLPGREGVVESFRVAPELSGLERLSERLAPYAGSTAVVEPTSMTWLALSIALSEAGVGLRLLGNRHAARLRGALAGKDKSDVIDAEVLSRAAELFGLDPVRVPPAGELALRRVCQRRHKALVERNRAHRRLHSLAAWAFPDVWIACASSRTTVVAVLTRWPHLEGLSRAQLATITDLVAAHTRGVADAGRRAERIRQAARHWSNFWQGHLDLDVLAWETAELVSDLAEGDGRVARAESKACRLWEALWGDDPLLLSVPGMGPRTAPMVRAFWGDASFLPSAREAAAYVGLAPSTWSSGTISQPSRAITKEGPACLRLALYQAANVARGIDPQLAAFYRKLMVERGHTHTQATVATARKLACRIWATLTSGRPYQLRDPRRPASDKTTGQRAGRLPRRTRQHSPPCPRPHRGPEERKTHQLASRHNPPVITRPTNPTPPRGLMFAPTRCGHRGIDNR